MKEILISAFTSICTLTVLSLVVKEFAVPLIKQWLIDKVKAQVEFENKVKFDQFTQDLKSEKDKEIVEFKNRLEIAAAERNFRYTQVFERTLKALEETYKELFNLQRASNRFATTIADPKTEISNFNDARSVIYDTLDRFRLFYVPLRIYFSNSTNKMIDEYVASIQMMANQLSRARSHALSGSNPQHSAQMLDTALEKWEKLAELLEKLESEFRGLLGLHLDSPPPTRTAAIQVPQILFNNKHPKE